MPTRKHFIQVAQTERQRWDALRPKMTIYEALKAKLNREPTNAELKADVHRILTEAMIERAEQGKLRHQRKRR